MIGIGLCLEKINVGFSSLTTESELAQWTSPPRGQVTYKTGNAGSSKKLLRAVPSEVEKKREYGCFSFVS